LNSFLVRRSKLIKSLSKIEKKFSENSSISFSLDAKDTNQYTKSFGANISLSSKF